MGKAVGDDTKLADQRFDPVEHGIHALSQRIETVAAAIERHPVRQITAAHRLRRRGDTPHPYIDHSAKQHGKEQGKRDSQQQSTDHRFPVQVLQSDTAVDDMAGEQKFTTRQRRCK